MRVLADDAVTSDMMGMYNWPARKKGDSMLLRGKIEDGKIVLEETRELPEGAAVEVYVMVPKDPSLMRMNPDLAKYFGIADDLPPNSSQSIDQVLYGTPDE